MKFWRLIFLFSMTAVYAVVANDNLTVTGGSASTSATITLNGISGNVNVGNLANTGTGTAYTAVKIDDENHPFANDSTITNYGQILGLIDVVDGTVNIYNHGTMGLGTDKYAISAIGNGGTGTTKSTTGTNDTATFTTINLHNYGHIDSSIGAKDSFYLENRGTIISGGTGGDAIEFSSGTAVIHNYGLIVAVAGSGTSTGTTPSTGTATPNAIMIGEKSSGTASKSTSAGSGTETKPVSLTLLNYSGGEIRGNIQNSGTLVINNFAGKMTGDFINKGTMSIGVNQVAFDGNYSASSSSGSGTPASAGTGDAISGTLNITIDNDVYGKLFAGAIVVGSTVTGHVDLTATTVNVDIRGGNVGKYTIIEAENGLEFYAKSSGGTPAAGTPAASSSGSVNIYSTSRTLDYQYDIILGGDKTDDITKIETGYVVITASAKPQAFHNQSTSRDQNLGKQLDAMAAKVPASMQGLYSRLNAIDNPAELEHAISQLNNRQADNAQTQLSMMSIGEHTNAVRHLLRNMGTNKLAHFAGGFSPNAYQQNNSGATGAGEKFYRGNSFAQFYTSFGQQQSSDETAGYDFGNFGTLLGIDYAFARELRVGILGGISYNQSDLRGGYGNSTDLMTRVGSYLSLNWDGVYFDFAPTFGLHNITNNRHINIGGWQTIARSDRTAWDVSALFNAGITMNFPAQIYVTPELSLTPTIMRNPSYSEFRGDGGVNLATAARTTWSLLQVFQVKVGALITIDGDTKLQPEFFLGWEHEYNDTAGVTTNNFVNAPTQQWENTLSAINRDRLLIGLGLSALILDDIAITGRWEQRVWSEGFCAAFTLGLTLNF